MKYRKDSLNVKLSNCLIAAAVCLHLPLAAYADDAAVVTQEPVSSAVTAAQQRNAETATESSQTKMLFGSVKKCNEVDNVANGAANLQSEKPLQASVVTDVHALALKKLAAGIELTSDEYRSLGIGCVGLESNRTFFQKIGRVIAIYRGSPADEAKIRVGDRIVQNDSDEQAKAHPDVPLWSIDLAQAGTPEDITVLRHGHPVTLTLTRMNVEDIQEDKVRHEWEKIIRNLGYPHEGTFTGRSLNDLKPSSDGAEK